MNISELIGKLLFLLFLLGIPVGAAMSIITMVSETKCFGKQLCENMSCPLRVFCRIYQKTPSQEEIDAIEEMLRERRKELNEQNRK